MTLVSLNEPEKTAFMHVLQLQATSIGERISHAKDATELGEAARRAMLYAQVAAIGAGEPLPVDDDLGSIVDFIAHMRDESLGWVEEERGNLERIEAGERERFIGDRDQRGSEASTRGCIGQGTLEAAACEQVLAQLEPQAVPA